MKKMIASFLALIMVISLLPMAVMAETPTEVQVQFCVAASTKFSKTIADGETAYVIAGDDKVITDWTETDAPVDNFMKLVYDTEKATLKVTFKNFVADMTDAGGYACHGIEFLAGEYAVAIELIGENSLSHGKFSCIKYNNAGGMTITGAGSMSLNIGTSENIGSASGALWANGGDLLIKDTTMSFAVYSAASAKHHAIFASQGSVTFDNAKTTSTTYGGQVVFLGTTDFMTGRYTLDTATDRFIIIKNSEITATAQAEIFKSTTNAIVQNSSLTLTCTGGSGPIFTPAPVLEGSYTALAGLAKYADQPERLKTYNLKKLSSYTYIKITHEHTIADCTNPQCVCGKVVASPAEAHIFNRTASEILATEATCAELATYYVRCDNCQVHSLTKRITVGEYADHTMQDDGDCTTAVYCSVCNKKLISAELEHIATTREIVILEPTCNSAGIKEVQKRCYRDGCDMVYSTQIVEIPPIAHHGFVFTDEITAPTCTKDGTIISGKVCVDCDTYVATVEQAIPATGHSYIKGQTINPSYTKKGYTMYTCETCGASTRRDFVTLANNGLQEAINAAAEGETIRLHKNYKNATTITIPAGKKITLDLNGKYYSVGTVTNGAALMIEEGAELILIGGSKLAAQASAAKQFDAVVKNAGKLTIQDVTLNAANLYADDFVIINTGDLTLTEGAVLNVIKAVSLSNTGAIVNNSGVDIDAPKGYHWSAEGILEAHDYSTVTNVPATCEKVSYDLYECACGASYEDNYGTKKLSVAARIGTELYATLQEAINAAEEGDTVVLAKGIKDAKTVYVAANKKITIDLNGFYYAAAKVSDGAVMVIEDGAELVIKNGKLHAQYTVWNLYDCVVRNNGKLTIENATVNGNNLFKKGAATIINNGETVLGEGAVINVNKKTNTESIGNPFVEQ